MSEKENEKITEIVVPEIEILDNTPDEVKADYFYRLLMKNQVEEYNHNIDLKSIEKEFGALKEDLQLDGVTAGDFKKAYDYMFPKVKGVRPESALAEDDVINKISLQADRIEYCMIQIRLMLGGNDNDFSGVDTKLISKIKQIEETKEGIENVKDKTGEAGLDKKAIDQMVKEEIKDQDPNKKPPKDTLLIDEQIKEYDDMLLETKQELYPLPLTKVDD